MIPGDWGLVAVITAGCALLALATGTVLLRALRTGPVVAHLLVVSAAAVATVTAAVLVTTWQMFLSGHDARVVLVVAALSALCGAAVAVMLGRSLRRASRLLAAAAVRVGDPSYPGAPAVPTTELGTVAAALDAADARLSAARTAAAATEQSRRQLVAGMNHDLRTPLAGMRAMVESLEDGVVSDPDTVGRYHRQMRVEIDRVAGMVADLFELSRVEGALQLHLERVAAADLVTEALASADPVARAKGVTLVADTGDGLPVQVDTTEFGRVMRNLLLNAIRHTPADGTIAVTAAAGDGQVSFAVTDTCGGIPDHDLDHVFETAFRGNAARTATPHQGGGLGLAIARGIVEAHHGAIRVANHQTGCRFEVVLPLAQD